MYEEVFASFASIYSVMLGGWSDRSAFRLLMKLLETVEGVGERENGAVAESNA